MESSLLNIVMATKQFISKILIFWLGLLFISPLFGIHIHHSLNSSNKELSTIVHSSLGSNHESSHQTDSSPPQPLYDHIAPNGITSDLGDWDSNLVYDAIFIFMLLPLLLSLSFTFILSLYQFFISNDFEISSFLTQKKSYRSFCLLNLLPPPSIV